MSYGTGRFNAAFTRTLLRIVVKVVIVVFVVVVLHSSSGGNMTVKNHLQGGF